MFVVVGCAATTQSYGQTDWQFTRLDDAGVFVSAREFPTALFNSSFDEDQAAGDILVNIATIASASNSVPDVGSAFAQSTSMAQAMNLTPVGATTSVPTVDTTVTNSSTATATNASSFISASESTSARIPNIIAESQDSFLDGGVSAASSGSFELDGMPASGFLQGSIYLFGAVTGSESATGNANARFNGDGDVQACVEGSCVEADYDGNTELWEVNVSLPGVTEIFFTSSLNHYFTFTIPVTLPRTIDMNATSRTPADSLADATFGGSATAQGMANLSASAWAVFTPTDDPLPDGDFDADGDVDGADFLSFQRGFSETMGATLSQGDANHDGNVDSADLALWGGNFGTTGFSSVSANLAVPEPTTSAIALATLLLAAATCTRFHGDPRP